jgi:hypothetical protein
VNGIVFYGYVCGNNPFLVFTRKFMIFVRARVSKLKQKVCFCRVVVGYENNAVAVLSGSNCYLT